MVAFQNAKESNVVALPNFLQSKPIKMARPSRQYKMGNEEISTWQQFYDIKSKKKWIGHLPGCFSEQLFIKHFLDDGGVCVVPILKRHCNTHFMINTG